MKQQFPSAQATSGQLSLALDKEKAAVLAQDKGSLMAQMTEQSSHHQVELKQVIQVKNTASQEEQGQEQAELKQDIRFLFFLLSGMLVWFWLVESYVD